MKTQAEMRLECIRMAASLAVAKLIGAQQIVPWAMDFHRWVLNGNETASAQDMAALQEHYR